MTAVDVGIRKLASLSNHQVIENPKFLERHERRLAIRQRRLSRKKKGSKNRAKERNRVARLHQTLKRQREDYHWKAAKLIAQSGDLIGFEDLNIKNMKARCRVKVDPETGQYLKNGQKAKSQLNKAISDAAWYGLRMKTIHQATKLGNRLITVNPRESSLTCSSCGYVSPQNRDKERFLCEACNYFCDSDIQASLILKQRTIEAFYRDEKEVKPKDKKLKSQHKSSSKTKKQKSSVLESKSEKLRVVSPKVTPKPEVTGSNYGEKSVSVEVEPGNFQVSNYRQLSLFDLLSELEKCGDGETFDVS